jgi:hypothetical protein
MMRIAITGHKHGIGKAFAEQLSARSHEIIGVSRSDGENIRRIPHTASIIEPCDLFINNAQSQFAQTELFYEVWSRWKNLSTPKWIWNIGTQMTQSPSNSVLEGHTDVEISLYRTQKKALETATEQLQWKARWPKISMIRPGEVNTQKISEDGSNVNTWVSSVINTFTLHENIHIREISIGHIAKRIPI